MKLADNLDMHTISNKFESRPDRTIDFGVSCTCPLVPKNHIFNHVLSIACLVLTETLLNLQLIWTGIKSQTSSNFGQIGLLTFELLALCG